MRSRLLETARELIARQGEAALSLSAVADAAGLANATVYGYFAGKRDLLAALESAPAAPLEPAPVDGKPAAAAEDEHAIPTWMDYQPELSAFLPHMADALSVEPAAQVTGETAAPETPSHAESAGEMEAPPAPEAEQVLGQAQPQELEKASTADPCAEEPGVQPAPAGQPDETAEPQEAPAGESAGEGAVPQEQPEALEEKFTPYEQERRLQAAHLEEIAKRLILPESALKEGTDAVISRLETRMRVLERSIASLETRHNAACDYTDKAIKPVGDLVAQLQARADAADDRQRQALAELRLSVHELSARQDALAGTTALEPVTPLPVWPEPETASAAQAETPAAADIRDVPPEDVPEACEEKPRHDYLAAVRNSAKEGARQAAERETQEEEEQQMRRRRLLTAAGIAVACLALVGVLFRFNPGSHGVSVAQSKVAPEAVQAAKPAPARTPLDRLAALANDGNVAAELVVGLKYLKGDGVAANDKLAALWLTRAANAGNAVAQNHLGALYQAGRGVPHDIKTAMHWYEAAAAQGDRHAMSNLAVLHAGGAGMEADFTEAARWFQKSASLGYVDAQFNLAVLFERGDGVPQSLLDAYKWYTIAAMAGDSVARQRADAIATQVSAEELSAAQQAARGFKPEPLNRAANDIPSMAEVLAQR